MDGDRPRPPRDGTLAGRLASFARELSAAGSGEPEAEARYAFRELLGATPARLALARFEPFPAEAEEILSAYLARRTRREPPQYIVGRAHFLDLTLAVREGCLIPRPETERLVELALPALLAASPPRFLEIGIGSGCVTAALLASRPGATAVATDRSSAALAIARRNLAEHGLLDRAELREEDLYTGAERFPLVVSNPPYIATGELASLAPELSFEPREALDGGPDGLAVIARIVALAPRILRPGGTLALETGCDQEAGVAALAARHGLERIGHFADLAGRPRVALLRLPPAPEGRETP